MYIQQATPAQQAASALQQRLLVGPTVRVTREVSGLGVILFILLFLTVFVEIRRIFDKPSSGKKGSFLSRRCK
jgi:hypothetical protein